MIASSFLRQMITILAFILLSFNFSNKMIKKRLLFLLFIGLILPNCNLQKNIIQKQIESPFVQEDSGRLLYGWVTNRDYIIYLHWLNHIYGESYPEQVLKALPEQGKIDFENLTLTFKNYDPCVHPDIKAGMFGNSYCDNHENCNTYPNFIAFLQDFGSPLLQNYIFNPSYIDYPMTGLSPLQIYEMGKWMTDRYNENMLIQFGYLHPNVEQKDEDNFVTESYAIEQYQGNVRKVIICGDTGEKMNVPWTNQLFLPLFHPPQEAIETTREKPLFQAYSPPKHHFLKTWEKLFQINYHMDTQVAPDFKEKMDITKLSSTIKELIISDFYDDCTPKAIKINVLPSDKDNYPWKEKDSLGRMPFVITGSTVENLPTIIEDTCLKKKMSGLEDNGRYIFRFEINRKNNKY